MLVSAAAAVSVDPRRPIAQVPVPVPATPAWRPDAYRPVAPAAPAEEPRIVAQRRALQAMMDRLGQDARLAAIMLNPIFLPHAQGIAHRATARALVRYETELPRKDLDVLLREEQLAARAQIMQLPQRYYETGAQALETASDFMVTTAEETGNALVQGAKIAKDVVVGGAVAIAGGIWTGLKACLHGVGAALTWVGGALQSGGGSLQEVGR